jgi:hypothetical protein
MSLCEFNTHSFIVKVWLEEPADAQHGATWRGHITHVPSGTRRTVQTLDDIDRFIATYLERMGVRRTTGQRVQQWLSRWKR